MTASKATRQLTLTAMFIALVVLLGLTPLGLIPLGFINVTILHIPVIIGTLVLGLKGGLILGCTFGLVSTLRAFGIPLPASALVSNLMAESPLLVVAMSMLPRLLVPVATHGVYRLLEGRGAHPGVALAVSAVAGTLTNTIFYLGLMLLFYVLTALDAAAVLGLIAGTGALGGGAEAVVAALLTTPVVLALRKIPKRK